MKIIVAVDPGQQGAFCYRDMEGSCIELYQMPLIGKEIDSIALREMVLTFLRRCEINLDTIKFYIERPSSRPGNAAQAMLRYGWGIGILEGILCAYKIPFQWVPPQTWTKELHRGIPGNLQAKEKSKLIAHQLFPSIDFKRNDRCKVDDEGYLDAALIAEYGVRQERGSTKFS